jgi:hypothetical protein
MQNQDADRRHQINGRTQLSVDPCTDRIQRIYDEGLNSIDFGIEMLGSAEGITSIQNYVFTKGDQILHANQEALFMIVKNGNELEVVVGKQVVFRTSDPANNHDFPVVSCIRHGEKQDFVIRDNIPLCYKLDDCIRIFRELMFEEEKPVDAIQIPRGDCEVCVIGDVVMVVRKPTRHP